MDCDDSPPQATTLSNRFGIWQDLLVERQLSEAMQKALAHGKSTRRANDGPAGQNVGEWLPGREENDKVVRPGSKRSTKRNKMPKIPLAKAGSSKKNNKKKRKKSPLFKMTQDIAVKLKEPRRDLIENVVKTLGEAMAIRFLNESLTIESAGGLMTTNGSRRRSPGGVFFHLVQTSKNVTKEQVKSIFGLEQAINAKGRKWKKKQNKKFDALADTLKSFNLTNAEPSTADDVADESDTDL